MQLLSPRDFSLLVSTQNTNTSQTKKSSTPFWPRQRQAVPQLKAQKAAKSSCPSFSPLHPFCSVPLLRPLLVIWSSRSNSCARWGRALARWCLAPRFSGCRSLWPWCAWPGSSQLQRCSDCPKDERWTVVSSSPSILLVFVFSTSSYC